MPQDDDAAETVSFRIVGDVCDRPGIGAKDIRARRQEDIDRVVNLAGVRIARRINAVLFYRFIYAGMFLTGCKLVWDGFF